MASRRRIRRSVGGPDSRSSGGSCRRPGEGRHSDRNENASMGRGASAGNRIPTRGRSRLGRDASRRRMPRLPPTLDLPIGRSWAPRSRRQGRRSESHPRRAFPEAFAVLAGEGPRGVADRGPLPTTLQMGFDVSFLIRSFRLEHGQVAFLRLILCSRVYPNVKSAAPITTRGIPSSNVPNANERAENPTRNTPMCVSLSPRLR